MENLKLHKEPSFEFLKTDNSMYERAYDLLVHLKETLNTVSARIFNYIKQNTKVKYMRRMENLATSLRNSDFGSLFLCSTVYVESIQEILANSDTNETEQSIGNSLLDVCLKLSRIFSCVCGPISAEKTIKHEHHLTHETPNEGTEQDSDNDDYDDEVVLCRICEEYVPVSLITKHNESCLIAYESEFDMISTDTKIRKLLKTFRNNVLNQKWPGERENTIKTILPLFHAATILEHSLGEQCELSLALTGLKNIEVGTEDQQLVVRAITLIAEKLRAQEAYTEASVVLKKTRVSGSSIGASPLQTSIADFRFIKRISSGAYAKVYLAEKTRTKDTYAIKVTPRSTLKHKNDFQRAITEKDILLRNSNPYIVDFYYSIIGTNNLYLVMDFVPGGDLYSLLQEVGCLDEEYARVYTAQIIKALEYLHGNEVVHRDLKPDNILVTSTGKLKLTDFGLSLYGAFDRGITEVVGTPGYIAPEIISSKEHSFPVDFWSLGAVLFEFLTGVPPFNRETERETYAAILSGKCNYSLLEGVSNEAIDLIKKLLVVDPANRLGTKGISEIMSHPWFKDIDWNHVDDLPPPFVPKVKPLSTEFFEERYKFEESDVIEKDIISDIENAKRVIPRSVSMTDLSINLSDSDTEDKLDSDDDYSANSEVIGLYSSIALQNLSRKSQGEAHYTAKHRKSAFYQLSSRSFCVEKKPPKIPKNVHARKK